MHERGAGERGFDNKAAIEGEAPAVEQTRGRLAKHPSLRLIFFPRDATANWRQLFKT